MNWNKVEFCPELKLSGEVLNCDVMAPLLGKHVFKSSQYFVNVLYARYKQIQQNGPDTGYGEDWDLTVPKVNLCLEFVQDVSKPDVRLPVGIQHVSRDQRIIEMGQHPNFGHDMPLWFKGPKSNPRKRIMIVSIDPLRTGDSEGSIYLSTPFGLHCKDYRKFRNGESKLETAVVERLLEDGWTVYVTDYLKFFVERSGCVEHCFSDLFSRFDDMLKEELRLFDPTVVLAFGKSLGRWLCEDVKIPSVKRQAYNVLGRMLDGVSRQCVFACHPSKITKYRSDIERELNMHNAGWKLYVEYYLQGVNREK